MGRRIDQQVAIGTESVAAMPEGDKAEVVPIHRKRESAIASALLGSSAGIVRVRRAIGNAAGVHVPVLITGDIGTGRSLVAQLIHEGGARPGEFVVVRCGAHGALPAPLTREAQRRPGVHLTGGDRERSGSEVMTVFLDAVDELTPELQARLTDVLETWSGTAVTTAPRIIASTAIDLEEAVEAGRLRGDLLHRLNVLQIAMPSLVARGREDFAELARAFSVRQSRPIGLTERAIDWLFARSWPANVRELRNIIERLTVMTDSETVDVEDLHQHVGAPAARDGRTALDLLVDGVFAADAPSGGRHSSVELAMIARALEISDSETAAARLLGMDRRIMLRRRTRLEKGPQKRKPRKAK